MIICLSPGLFKCVIPVKEELAFLCRKKQGERKVHSYTCVFLPFFMKVIHASVKPEGALFLSMHFLGFTCRNNGCYFWCWNQAVRVWGILSIFKETVLKNTLLSRF